MSPDNVRIAIERSIWLFGGTAMIGCVLGAEGGEPDYQDTAGTRRNCASELRSLTSESPSPRPWRF